METLIGETGGVLGLSKHILAASGSLSLSLTRTLLYQELLIVFLLFTFHLVDFIYPYQIFSAHTHSHTHTTHTHTHT